MLRSIVGLPLAAALLATPAAAREAGIAAAVNADSLTKPPLEDERTLVVGHNVVFDEKITTGPKGQAQLLMLDQSALTVAPNSELVIDTFVYDPDKKTGEMAMTLSRGLMRFVGGRLSKTGGVQVKTPVATMGIRGGIALVNVVSPTVVDVTLLFGDAITGVTDTGQPFALRRTGYFTRIENQKGASPPQPATAATVGNSLAKLQGRADADGGADEKPTDEGAEASIGDGALAGPIAPEVDFQVEAIGTDGDLRDVLVDPDSGIDDELFNNNEFVEQTFETGSGRSGGATFDATARVLTVNNPDPLGDENLNQINEENAPSPAPNGAAASLAPGETGVDPNNFNDGDRIFSIFAEDGSELVSLANGAPLAFADPVLGNPDNVNNIFDAEDANVYISPTTYNVGAGAQAGGVLAAQNDFGPSFFNYDLSTADFDGVNGQRLTLTGGAGIRTAQTGRTFFDANGDTQTTSLLPFSEIGRAQLPIGGGLGGIVAIDPAAITETPIMVDWDKGKLLYIGGVFQNLDGAGDKIYGIQAVTGDLQGDGSGNFIFSGVNAGSSHDLRGDESRLFHAGDAVGTPLGDATLMGISLDGDHAALEHLDENDVRQDPVTVVNHQFGVQTGAPALGATGAGTTTESLFAATIVADVDGDLETLATNPDVGGVGTMTINRTAMEIASTFIVEDDEGGVETFTNNVNNSAFFDDNTFAITGKDGDAGVGLVAVSGEAAGVPNACACVFMHWGLWAAGDAAPGETANAVTDIGVFFAGVPTIDMPISGLGTFTGRAYASMITPADATPSLREGAFTLQTNFALGVSSGSINLGAARFDMVGAHAVGAPGLTVDYFSGDQNVGDGHGSFFGTGARNVGVTIDIDDGAGTKAAGAAVGQR